MAELCTRWGTVLPTAALQFSLRDPRIAFTVVGISKKRRLEALLRASEDELAPEFWDELETLVPAPEHFLDAR
jgi:D-threo-aldose 1-dehydrogenase